MKWNWALLILHPPNQTIIITMTSAFVIFFHRVGERLNICNFIAPQTKASCCWWVFNRRHECRFCLDSGRGKLSVAAQLVIFLLVCCKNSFLVIFWIEQEFLVPRWLFDVEFHLKERKESSIEWSIATMSRLHCISTFLKVFHMVFITQTGLSNVEWFARQAKREKSASGRD